MRKCKALKVGQVVPEHYSLLGWIYIYCISYIISSNPPLSQLLSYKQGGQWLDI